MEDSAVTTITTEEATKAARIWIRAFMRAANRMGDQRKVIEAQEAKISEQAAELATMKDAKQRYYLQLQTAKANASYAERRVAKLSATFAEQRQVLLDRYDAAMKAQAFQLGRQDRELIQLRSRVKAAEAGDVATLRINNAFQHSEIMRLKAALAEREEEAAATSIVIEAAITIPIDQWEAADVAGWLATVNENASAFMEWRAAHAGSREAALEAKVAELEAERNELLQGITVNSADIERLHKAANEERQRANKAEADLAYLRSQSATTTLAIAQGRIKALSVDVERLKGVADHSNNLAQNRLEELAKLRRELAVARDATTKLEAKLADYE